MTSEKPTWPRCSRPFDSNPVFPHEVRPPLRCAWTHRVTGKFNDGRLVGGLGHVAIAARGRDIDILALESGEVCHVLEAVREPESTGFSMVGYHVYIHKFERDTVRVDVRTGKRDLLPELGSGVGFLRLDDEECFQWDHYEMPLSNVDDLRPREWPLGIIVHGRYFSSPEGLADALTGQLLWKHPKVSMRATSPRVFVGFYREYKQPSEIRVLSFETGELLWSRPTRNPHALPVDGPRFTVTDELVLLTEGGVIEALAIETGERVWEFRQHVEFTTTPIVTGSVVWWAAVCNATDADSWQAHLFAIDLSTGEELWRKAVRGKLANDDFALCDSSLLFQSGQRVHCYRPEGEA